MLLSKVYKCAHPLKLTGAPWTDKKMVYLPFPGNNKDYDYFIDDDPIDRDRRYVLTPDYVKNAIGINIAEEIGNHSDMIIFLNEISEIVYSFLYENIRPESVPIVEYRIAKKYEDGGYKGRKAIMKAMHGMVKYALSSSGDLVGYQTGFNVETGMITDIDKLRGRIIIPDYSEKQLRAARLLWPGEYNYCIDPDDYRRDY